MPSGNGGASGDGTRSQLLVEIRVPASAVGLATAMAELSGGTVEAEQLVPNAHDPFSYVWVTGVSPSGFEDALADDQTIAAATRNATFDTGALYELEWDEPRGPLQQWLRRHGIPILRAEASLGGEAWYLKLRLDSRERLTALQTYCDDRDVNLDLRRLYSLDQPKMGQFGVSEKQLSALLTAYEMGYFEIPRDCRLVDVADRLDLSTEATSERIRRGLTNLLADSLVVGNPSSVGVGTEK